MTTGLVLSGGASKGAFQVGVIDYLAQHNILPQGVEFVSGVSVGALNALAVAAYPAGQLQLQQAAAKMHMIWDALKCDQDIWQYYFPPVVAGLWKQSIGTNAPLKQLLESYVSTDEIRKSGVAIRIPAVDLLTGELHVFDEQELSLIPPVLASSSFPVVFPPETIGNGLYTDGGIRDIAPLKSAIVYGCDHIVVVSCRHIRDVEAMTKEELNSSLKIAMRCLDIMETEILSNDILRCQVINKAIDDGAVNSWKKIQLDIIYPTTALGSPLHFNQETIQPKIRQGYVDAELYYNKKGG